MKRIVELHKHGIISVHDDYLIEVSIETLLHVLDAFQHYTIRFNDDDGWKLCLEKSGKHFMMYYAHNTN